MISQIQIIHKQNLVNIGITACTYILKLQTLAKENLLTKWI